MNINERETDDQKSNHFFRLFDFVAALDETLAALEVAVDVALLLEPFTALTCLFCGNIHVSYFVHFLVSSRILRS